MESAAPIAVLLGIFFLVVVPVLAIAAFARVQKLQESVDQLSRLLGRITAIEQKFSRLEAATAPASVAGPAAAEKPAPIAAPPMPQPPTQAPPRIPPPPIAPPMPLTPTPERPAPAATLFPHP